MSDVLDLSDTVARNAELARRFGRQTLLLVVSARNCAGCDVLAEQLASRPLRSMLAGTAYVVKVDAGDLYDAPARTVRVGPWTLESPGFPTTWAFQPCEEGLRFAALHLGPFDQDDPEDALEDLLAGRSGWVPEAEALTVQACSGLLCLPLNAKNGFFADFVLPTPAA